MLAHVRLAGSVQRPAAFAPQNRRLVFRPAGLNLTLLLVAQLSNL